MVVPDESFFTLVNLVNESLSTLGFIQNKFVEPSGKCFQTSCKCPLLNWSEQEWSRSQVLSSFGNAISSPWSCWMITVQSIGLVEYPISSARFCSRLLSL